MSQVSIKENDFLLAMCCFGNFCFQNYVICKPLRIRLSLYTPSYVKVTAWKSTGLPSEEIRTPNSTVAPATRCVYNEKSAIKFSNFFLVQKSPFFSCKKC